MFSQARALPSPERPSPLTQVTLLQATPACCLMGRRKTWSLTRMKPVAQPQASEQHQRFYWKQEHHLYAYSKWFCFYRSPAHCCCCCLDSTWAFMCCSAGEGSGSYRARRFLDASRGPCCPALSSSERLSAVWCCITKTHHGLWGIIDKSGLASWFLRLINNDALSLATNVNRWITDNRSSDVHHNENHIIGRKRIIYTCN